MLKREFRGRDRAKILRPEAAREFAQAQFLQAARRVDQDVPGAAQAFEQIDLVEQGRVLDDHRVGRDDRLAIADLFVSDPAEGDDRRARALGAEAREGLRVPSFPERRDRQQLRGRDHALAAAPVNPDLKHFCINT